MTNITKHESSYATFQLWLKVENKVDRKWLYKQ